MSEPIETSIDEKDQKRERGHSPFEYVVSLWLVDDIVCQERSCRTKTQQGEQYDKANDAEYGSPKLFNDIHQDSEEFVVACVGEQRRLQGQRQDQDGFE